MLETSIRVFYMLESTLYTVIDLHVHPSFGRILLAS